MERGRLSNRWSGRTRDGRDVRAGLRTWPTFSACSSKELALVDGATYETHLEAGRLLATEGELPRQVVFVLVGTAEQTAGGAVMGAVGPGACIGGLATIAKTCQETTVRARTPMVVRVATPVEYRSLVRRIPRLDPRNHVVVGAADIEDAAERARAAAVLAAVVTRLPVP